MARQSRTAVTVDNMVLPSSPENTHTFLTLADSRDLLGAATIIGSQPLMAGSYGTVILPSKDL